MPKRLSPLLIIAGCSLIAQTLTAIVTSDDYGTHITTPGIPEQGVDHDGVGQIRSNGSFSCTGSLLEGGMHVLTAGHCVVAENINSIVVRFETESGIVDIAASSWTAHPDYPETFGTDLGIITLAERAPVDIPRYRPLLNAGDEIDVPNLIFGYGRTGFAGTGKDVRDGNKRWGRNKYEATGATGRVNQATVGGSDEHRVLFSDFDNGKAENDAFGFHFGKVDLGFGEDEVYASNGDSGGPILIDNGFGHVIAATVSSGRRYQGNPNADIDEQVNATWGQFSLDTRVAHPNNLAFIQSHTKKALEPITLRMTPSESGPVAKLSEWVDSPIYLRVSHDLDRWQNSPALSLAHGEVQIPLADVIDFDSHATWFIEAQREPTTPPILP